MKCCFVLLLLGCLLTAPSHFERRRVLSVGLSSQAPTKLSVRCLGDDEILTRLEILSTGPTPSDHLRVQSQLVADARKSPDCRKRVVTALLKAMDKPALDLQNDRPTFYLWHYGAEILGTLKAEEAFDLLIQHLDLNDGTLFPLNHHPALVSIIQMGSIAIPKLTAVLRSPDSNARQYAVFCLGEIGGPDAKGALQRALTSESNSCVSSFIKASLQAFDKSSSGYQIAPEDRTQWYSTFLCNEAG